MQQLIDNAKDNALINVLPGTYLITSLVLKSNITLHLLKDALLTCSTKEEDYKEKLAKEQEEVNSIEFIEKTAREMSDMYLPNERVYIDAGL